MSTIESISFLNYGPFRGEHTVRLEPKAYAVVARLDGAPERSNFVGKSTFLSAARHAIFGDHDLGREDEWVTKGELEGYVEVSVRTARELFTVRRTRAKTTRLEVIWGVAHDMIAKGPKAEPEVERLVGMSLLDFDRTCYFRQKQVAALVTARPGERMEVVRGWLRLEKLEASAEHARADLAAASQRHRHAASEAQAARHAAEALVTDLACAGGPIEDYEALFVTCAKRIEERTKVILDSRERARGDLALLEDQRDRSSQLRAAAEKQATRARVVADGKALRARIESRPVPSAQQVEDLQRAASEAMAAMKGHERDVRAADKLAVGEFDGACPVLPGFACPARDDLNSRGQAARTHKDAATGLLEAARGMYEGASRAAERARADRMAHESDTDRLVQLRDRLREMGPEPTEPPQAPQEPAELAMRVEEARRVVAHADALLAACKRALEKVGVLRQEALAAQVRMAEARASQEALRGAVAAFGRDGAQRAVSERAVAAIQGSANAALARCGIGLSMAVRWEREGKEPAATCEACGAALPRTATCKACPQCGEPRGNARVQRMDVVLSNRSGGAEDLAGVAFQLAAGAWLRRKRHLAWSTAMLDEPYGALDAAHRRALSNHLAAMLPEYGYEQSLVVSHTQGTSEGLPGRIVVIGNGRGDSRVVVEA